MALDWVSSIIQIVLVNAVVSGDNAMVIALAAHRLPAAQRRQAMALGKRPGDRDAAAPDLRGFHVAPSAGVAVCGCGSPGVHRLQAYPGGGTAGRTCPRSPDEHEERDRPHRAG